MWEMFLWGWFLCNDAAHCHLALLLIGYTPALSLTDTPGPSSQHSQSVLTAPLVLIYTRTIILKINNKINKSKFRLMRLKDRLLVYSSQDIFGPKRAMDRINWSVLILRKHMNNKCQTFIIRHFLLLVRARDSVDWPVWFSIAAWVMSNIKLIIVHLSLWKIAY